MKNILLFLTALILCGCNLVPKDWHIPTIPEVINTATNQPPTAPADTCPPNVVTAPESWIGGECPFGNNGPDIRFLIGKSGHDQDWKFFGKFAIAHQLYSYDGKTVTGVDGVVVDGITLHYVGQRQRSSGETMNTNKVVEYKATHRVYFEARQ